MRPYFEADGIALYQGHNQMVLDILGLKPEDVALLWGDPPYGIRASKRRAGSSPSCVRYAVRKNWQPMAGDSRPFDPSSWLDFPRVVLWGANHYASCLPSSPSWWIWDKRCGQVEGLAQADGEAAWTNFPGTLRIFRHLWSGVCTASEAGSQRLHPTQKPIALAAWGFRQAKLKPGDLVVSPWLGSGPEAVAARDMGLRFIGIELVPEYLDACVNRLRQAPLPLVAPPQEPEQAPLF